MNFYNSEERLEVTIQKAKVNSIYDNYSRNLHLFFKKYFCNYRKHEGTFDAIVEELMTVCPHVKSKEQLIKEITDIKDSGLYEEKEVAVPALLVRNSFLLVKIHKSIRVEGGPGMAYGGNMKSYPIIKNGEQMYYLEIRSTSYRIIKSEQKDPSVLTYRIFEWMPRIFDKEAIKFSADHWSDRLLDWHECGSTFFEFDLRDPSKLKVCKRSVLEDEIIPTYITSLYVSTKDSKYSCNDDNIKFYTMDPTLGKELIGFPIDPHGYCYLCGTGLGNNKCETCQIKYDSKLLEHTTILHSGIHKLPPKIWNEILSHKHLISKL